MSIINNALSGALAAQAALNATSQNVANAQTDGYTRQGALLTTVGPSGGLTNAGGGVQVSSLIRFSNDYQNQALELQLRPRREDPDATLPDPDGTGDGRRQ